MNILDMMNKITELSKPIVETKEEKTTHKGGTATTDEKGTKHKGKYGTDYQGDEDDDKTDDYGKKKKAKPAVAAPAEKRGRGRPAKGSDKDGNVMKPDWSAFGAKKDVKLPKYDKNKTTKHSLKDWIENLDTALNEDGQYTSSPLPGATAIKNPQGQQVATATTPQATAAMTTMINKGDVDLTDPNKALKEVGRNHMGETEYHGYYKWRVACRKAGAVEFVGDKDIDEGHDINGKAVGEWDGVVGSVYGDAHKSRPVPAGMNEAKAKKDYDQDGKVEDETAEYKGLSGKVAAAKKAKQVEEAKKAKPDFLDKDKDGNKKEPFKKAVKDAEKVEEAKKAKPDFLDKDKDGNKKEPFKKAVKDAEKNPADSKYDSRAGRRNGKDDAKANQVEEGKDEGKPGKNFAKIAKSAGKEYGSKAAGERVAGAVKAKLAKQGKLEEGKVKELSMDLEDRTMKDAEFKKKYGKSKADMQKSMKPADAKKPASKIKESILRESHDTMKHIINKFKHEVKKFVAGGDLDEDLYDALYDYYCDQGEMPYGTMKARDGDPYEWVTQRFDSDVQDHDVPMDEGAYSQDYFTANMDKPERTPVPRQTTPPLPKQTPWKRDPIAAATDRVYDVFNRPKAGTGDVQFESWAKSLDNLLSEGMNVVANTGLGDGPDSVTISATDEDALKLLAIVKSAGLGMFANDDHQEGDSPQMSIQPQNNPHAEIGVVDDHDDMLGLIRKMTGQGQPGAMEVEVDEEQGMNPGEAQGYQDEEMAAENTPTFGEVEPDQEGSSEEEVQQATDKLEKVHDVWSQAGSVDGEESSEEEGEESAEEESAEEESGEEESAEEESGEEEEEDLDEAYANGAEDTFETDIAFMQEVITGGVNGKKRTQSVGAPVTIASTPMRESTDLLKDWRTLSGIK